jgi:pimeloyl-ACP methyl ester carboxylesterase
MGNMHPWLLVNEVYTFVKAVAQYVSWLLRTRESRTGTFRAGDIDIFYREYGRGRPVLLLHGGFTFAETWVGQIPALADRYRVLATDSRGHGRTGLGWKPITYRQMAEDAIQLIEGLGLGPVDIVGWSDGGTTSLAMAMTRPDLIRSMVLLGTPFNVSNYSPDAWRRIYGFLRPWSPTLLILRSLRRLLAPARRDWEPFFRKMKKMWLELPDFTVEDLGKIEVPALVVACDSDEFLSPGDDPLSVFRQLAEALPAATIAEVPGGTHELLLERPGLVSELLLAFIG